MHAPSEPSSVPLTLYRRVSGFTLLELLISITLLLLIVVILGGAFRTGFRSLDGGERKIQALERFRTSLEIITAQLQSTVPMTLETEGVKKIHFKGNADALQFVSGYSIWGENRGTVIVSYRVETGADGSRALYAKERCLGMEDEKDIKLFDRMKHLSFSYFGKDVAEADGRWREEWIDDAVAPEQVQLTFRREEKEEKVLVPIYARFASRPI